MDSCPTKAVNGLQYHFISGLPRSGSTLLSAILLQNPRFHAGMSSPGYVNTFNYHSFRIINSLAGNISLIISSIDSAASRPTINFEQPTHLSCIF